MKYAEDIIKEIKELNYFEKKRIYDYLDAECFDYEPSVDDLTSNFSMREVLRNYPSERIADYLSKSDIIDNLKDRDIEPFDIEELLDGLSEQEREDIFLGYGFVKEDEEEDKESYPDVDSLLEELSKYVVAPNEIITYLNSIPEFAKNEIIAKLVQEKQNKNFDQKN